MLFSKGYYRMIRIHQIEENHYTIYYLLFDFAQYASYNLLCLKEIHSSEK